MYDLHHASDALLIMNIFIDGHSGTTGLEIQNRLLAHPDATLLQISPSLRKDPSARKDMMSQADITVLCLPDNQVPLAVDLAQETSTRIIDASTTHRTHPQWVYGFPELQSQHSKDISQAQRVSNPGCYAIASIALLRPLVDAALLPDTTPIAITATSGFSGGGRTVIEDYQNNNKPPVMPYALTHHHKHTKEIQLHSALKHPPLLIPHIANYYRGMLVHIPLHKLSLPTITTAQRIVDCYRSHYNDKPSIDILPPNANDLIQENRMSPICASPTDKLTLMVFDRDEQLILSAKLDNLGKGAAGTAVQNINQMSGFDNSTGLVLQ